MLNAHGTTRWVKSSYSGSNGGACLEWQPGTAAAVPVRDSKDTAAPALAFRPAAWRAFTTAVRRDAL